MSLRFLISSAALLALAACGGGGAGVITFPPTTLGDGTATYAELQDDLLNFDTYRANGPSSSLPSSGNATYGGTMVVADDLYNGGGTYINGSVLLDGNLISPSGYVGEVSLTANFTGGGGASVSGSVTNFYGTTINTTTGALTGSTVSVAGDLTLSNGTYPDAAIIGPTMDVTGDLAGMTADGQLIFEFFGPDGTTILSESLAAGGMTLDGFNTDARLSARQ